MPEIEDLPPSTAKSFPKQIEVLLSSPTANLSHLRILVVLIPHLLQFLPFFLDFINVQAEGKHDYARKISRWYCRKIQLTLNALFRSSAHNVSRKRCRFSSNVRMNSKI